MFILCLDTELVFMTFIEIENLVAGSPTVFAAWYPVT
jgi:hypothetical protein